MMVMPTDTATVVAVDWDVPCAAPSPSGRTCQHPAGHGGCCNTWGQTDHKVDEAWWSKCWRVGCTADVVPGWRGCAAHRR